MLCLTVYTINNDWSLCLAIIVTSRDAPALCLLATILLRTFSSSTLLSPMAYREKHAIGVRQLVNYGDTLSERQAHSYDDNPPRTVKFSSLYEPKFTSRSKRKPVEKSYGGRNASGYQAYAEYQQLCPGSQNGSHWSRMPLLELSEYTSAKTFGKKFFERQFLGDFRPIRFPLRWCKSVRALKPIRDLEMRGSKLSSCPKATSNLFSGFLLATLSKDRVDAIDKESRAPTAREEAAKKQCLLAGPNQPNDLRPLLGGYQRKRKLVTVDDNVDPFLSRPAKKARQAYMDLYDDNGVLLPTESENTDCKERAEGKRKREETGARRKAKRAKNNGQGVDCQNIAGPQTYIDNTFRQPQPPWAYSAPY